MTKHPVIAGVDEAGRGPLAGPVVAAACILPEMKRLPSFIRDSKSMTPEQREEAYEWIHSRCAYGIGQRGPEVVDEAGILTATEGAMQDAVAMLATSRTPTYLLIDGRDHFWFDYPHSNIIKGDVLERCISAASILAKVTRDRIMMAYAAEFPTYGFDAHKGYGAPEHLEALRIHGPCKIHRRSYLTNLLQHVPVSPRTTIQTRPPEKSEWSAPARA